MHVPHPSIRCDSGGGSCFLGETQTSAHRINGNGIFTYVYGSGSIVVLKNWKIFEYSIWNLKTFGVNFETSGRIS